MAGMLPGVELARRRRTNHHHYFDSHSRDSSLIHQRNESSTTTMDETALKARKRLEEKLRGSAGSRWSKPHPTNEGRRINPVAHAKDTHTTSTRLEKLPQHLDRRNSQREVCSICLDEFRTQEHVMSLPCAHRYHSDCLLPWLTAHSHCPYCRTHVQSS